MIYLVDSAIRQKKEIRHRSFMAPTKREIRQFSRRSRAVAAKRCSRNCAELLLFSAIKPIIVSKRS